MFCRRRRPAATCALLGLLTLTGCGANRYEARLKETAEYFAYQQKLNEALGQKWQEMGVSFRPPKQFQLIAPPPPPPAGDGEELVDLEPVDDPRQPDYLGVELPGLLGAWQAQVRADAGGAEEVHTAYLYVLGNHERYLPDSDDDSFSTAPEEFVTDVEYVITDAIDVELPDGEAGDGSQTNERYAESAPRVERFAKRQDFTAVTLKPENEAGLELPTEIQLYEWTGSRIQVAILMVYPASTSPSERLQERLLLALGTFEARDEQPRAGAAGAGGPRPPGGF